MKSGLRNEGFRRSANGGLYRQAEEIDADAYATYIVLTRLITGEGRAKALEALGDQTMTEVAADERLLALFWPWERSSALSRCQSSTPVAFILLTHPPLGAQNELCHG